MMGRGGISSSSLEVDAESGGADVDTAGRAVIGIKPVQQMSLWNGWSTSDPSKCDVEVRVGLYGA